MRFSLVIVCLAGCFAASVARAQGLSPASEAVVAKSTQMLDRAAEGLENLSRTGVDASVLVGLAPRSDREMARKAALAAIEPSAKAIDPVLRRQADLRAILEKAGDRLDASSEQTRADLARLPAANLSARAKLIEGRARLILSAVTEEQSESVKQAGAAADVLEGVELESTAGEGVRRVTLAMALHRAGRKTARDGQGLDDMLRSVVDLPLGKDPATTVPPAVVAEALGALAIVSDEKTGEKAAKVLTDAAAGSMLTLGGKPDLIFERLAAEVSVRVALGLDRGAKPGERGTIDAAIKPLVTLMKRQADRGDAAGELIFAGLIAEAIKHSGATTAQMSPTIALIWAERMWGKNSAGADEHEAARAKQSLVELSAGKGPEAAEALEYLAKNLLASDSAKDRFEAVGFLVIRAEKFAPSRATDLERALRELDRLKKDPGKTESDRALVAEKESPERLRVLERAVAISPRGEQSDGWRYEWVETMRAAHPIRTAAAMEACLTMLAPVDAASKYAQATMALAQACVLEAITAVQVEDAEAARIAGATLKWLAGPGAQLPSEGKVSIALAMMARNAEYRGAVALLEKTITDRKGLPGAVRRAAMLDLAKAQRKLGEPDKAFTTLKALSEELDVAPAAPGAPVRTAEFWNAWLGMLEIMRDEQAGDDRSGRIKLRLKQLELIDPALGGPEMAAKLRAMGEGK